MQQINYVAFQERGKKPLTGLKINSFQQFGLIKMYFTRREHMCPVQKKSHETSITLCY